MKGTVYRLDELLVRKMNSFGAFEYKLLEESAYYQTLMYLDNYDKSTKIFTDYISRLHKYTEAGSQVGSGENARWNTYNNFLQMYENIKNFGLSYKPSAVEFIIWSKEGFEPSIDDGQHRFSILKYLGFNKIYGNHGTNPPKVSFKTPKGSVVWSTKDKGFACEENFTLTSYE